MCTHLLNVDLVPNLTRLLLFVATWEVFVITRHNIDSILKHPSCYHMKSEEAIQVSLITSVCNFESVSRLLTFSFGDNLATRML